MSKQTPEQIKYNEAIERLDDIIAKIESDDIDVDELSVKVKEAIDLIRVCKAKINKAELEVKQIVEHLSAESKENG